MVFTPFTGVDNHKKCVTFGAGLLLKEDVESYVWVFHCFLDVVGREPSCIITDQDPSMRIAIEKDVKQEKIPDRYVCNRWCRIALVQPMYELDGGLIEQCVETDEKNMSMNQLCSEIYSCISIVEDQPVLLQQFVGLLKQHKEMLQSSFPMNNVIP
ncbi:unnamed protein product, partial [Cuscuta epithymum]